MKSQFTLFQSHIDLAHLYWSQLLRQGDHVIDATCGNGHDTLYLAKLNCNLVVGIDIQEEAIKNTQDLLYQELSDEQLNRVKLITQSHVTFPEWIAKQSVRLVVYNLGYLPGGDKEITTSSESTLQSLAKAIELIAPGGAISITCYPGHQKGKFEQERVLHFAQQLDPKDWSCCHHQWINRKESPSLLFIQQKVGSGHGLLYSL